MSNKPLKLLLLTDTTTHNPGDTTPALFQELSGQSGLEIFYSSPSDLLAEWSITGKLSTTGPLERFESYEDFLALPNLLKSSHDLEFFDAALDRSDLPLPVGYMETLARIEPRLNFLVSPSGVLKARSKDFVRQIPGILSYMPELIFSRDVGEIVAFLERHRDIVLKQVMGYGGRGVFRISISKPAEFIVSSASGVLGNFSSVAEAIEVVLIKSEGELQVVKYLKNVFQGDKRVLVVDGEIYGSYLRVSASGSWVQNVGQGGRRVLAEIGENERTVIKLSWLFYKELGLPILGYDFLHGDDEEGWLLSEINCGNVSGFSGYQELSGEATVSKLVSWIKNSITRK